MRRSVRYGSPRGVYCNIGLCNECLVTVNGMPNKRACVTRATPDCRIQTQDGAGVYPADIESEPPSSVERKQVQVAVVGGGPAGLSAAVAASRAGASVLVIDENRQAGGQIYRRPPPEFQIVDEAALGDDFADGESLLREFQAQSQRIETWQDSVVWSVFDSTTLAVSRDGNLALVGAEKIIVATGAYDRPVPFPGWTLPGVMTAGGAQAMLKSQRVIPGRRILLAGTGPLLLVVAAQMLEAGAEIAAVVEAGDQSGIWRRGLTLLRQMKLVRKGLDYRRRLSRAGVPLLERHVITEILGDDSVESAVVSEVDDQWHPIAGRSQSFDVDVVCVGYGFVPQVWLLGMLGCELQYDPMVGGWIPSRDDQMQTSREGIFAAGDGAGVAGVMAAASEGALAGLHSSVQLGLISSNEAGRQAERPRAQLNNLRGFRHVLDEISLIRPGLYAQIREDTIVCRCEDVTAGKIREAAYSGALRANDIKKRTRLGMGYCQGAICNPALAAMLSREFDVPIEQIGPMTARPPGRPVPMSLLLHDVE
jgi:thioredoxin reductase/bacterioferritin-associated ferredoxin